MELQQSNRTYSLLIGGVNVFTQEEITKIDSKKGVDKQALEFTPPFNLKFVVRKFRDVSKQKSESTFELYNLSDKTLKLLEESTKDLNVNLRVGYHSNQNEVGNSTLIQDSILKGTISLVSTKKSGTERVTSLIVNEGIGLVSRLNVSLNVAANKTVGDAIFMLATSLNQELSANNQPTLSISKSNFYGTNHTTTLPYGLPMRGSPSQILDNICNAYNLEYNIDNGKLHIDDSAGQIRSNTKDVFVYGYTTGLIDIPYFYTYDEDKILNKPIVTSTASGRKKTITKVKTKKTGVKFKALLNPYLKVGGLVQFDLIRDVNNIQQPKYFMVNSITFSGEWEGSEWGMEVECDEVDIIIEAA